LALPDDCFAEPPERLLLTEELPERLLPELFIDRLEDELFFEFPDVLTLPDEELDFFVVDGR
jgi:hypothetical protein